MSLLSALYWEKYYNGEPVPNEEKGYIYFENKILGRARLRQVRVKNHTCKVNEKYKFKIKHCYEAYSHDEEDKNGEKGSTENPHGLVVVGGRVLFGCLGRSLQALGVLLTVFF